jgi:hypothetical protein
MNSNDTILPACLVGFAEALPAPEVCFSLRTAGVRIVSFCRSNNSSKFARLNFVEYCLVTAPEVDFNRTVSDVENLIRRIRPELTIPCDDAALMVLCRASNRPDDSLSLTRAACDFAVNKWTQIEAASACGFSVMQTSLVTDESDVNHFPFRPAVLKPRDALDHCGSGLSKGRTFIIKDDHLPDEAKEALHSRPYLIQEYRAGVGEGYFGIVHDGKIFTGFGHRRVRMMNPIGSGSSACISREPKPDESKAVEALVKRVGWQGPFMVELLCDDSGTKWFMEFNGRFWGSLALARRCGLDMPRLVLDLDRGNAVTVPSRIDQGFARHLGRDIIHFLFVLRGAHPLLRRYTWSERLLTMKAVFAPHGLRSFYNYDPAQPFFFIKDAAITVLNAISGRRR